jgi:IS5 family transposase
MRSNKIDNLDLFTQAANNSFTKHIKTQSKRALEVIDQTINWNKIVKPLEAVINRSDRGRKPFPLLLIVKCFILQTIYGLSDPRLEEEIADRRSFQLFLGMTTGDSIPDETTICRYRELFAHHGLDRKLFKAFKKELKHSGLILEKGTLIDATIKEARTNPTNKRDADANFTIKRNKTYYGYKGHIGMDADSKMIHTTEFTKANIHDSDMFDHVTTGREKYIIADKGYANKKRKTRLRQEGVYCGILDKGYRNRPLSNKQKARNKKLSAIRNAVERPFAYAKHVLNYNRCSYYTLSRNRFQFNMVALVYNIRRYITLTCRPA